MALIPALRGAEIWDGGDFTARGRAGMCLYCLYVSWYGLSANEAVRRMGGGAEAVIFSDAFENKILNALCRRGATKYGDKLNRRQAAALVMDTLDGVDPTNSVRAFA